MEQKIHWYAVPNPEGFDEQSEWKRSAGVDDSGCIWVPAVIAGNELLVFLAIGYDGLEGVMLDGHLFVRSDWMRHEYPDTGEVLDKIEPNIKSWHTPNA